MSKFRKCEFSAWGHLSLEAAFGSRCRPGGGCGLRWRRAAAAGGGPEAAPPHPTARGPRAECQADPHRLPGAAARYPVSSAPKTRFRA